MQSILRSRIRKRTPKLSGSISWSMISQRRSGYGSGNLINQTWLCGLVKKYWGWSLVSCVRVNHIIKVFLWPGQAIFPSDNLFSVLIAIFYLDLMGNQI